VYVGWGSFTRLLWAPEGSHVILVVDGERHLSYLGNNCYGFGCVDFAGFPVGEKPITVPSGVPFRVDFPDLSPEQWTATVSRVPAYSGLDRRSSLPNLLRPSDALTLVSKWEAASNERATPAAPGWYIVDVNVGWARGQASYIFWLNVAAAPES
ncbi:MAG: hypothetical protein O3B65_03110, partial [Chloroflexi bacterium]|nr:hypothetical protein [Chloroflexota bacterium]